MRPAPFVPRPTPSRRVLLLDGATGTELRARGVAVPSHKTSIWSALALIEAPGAVVDLHRAYLAAGADVITANNYAVTPRLLAREGLASRVEELTRRAAQLAARARDREGSDARIAGSLPPLDTSYRAELVPDADELAESYGRIAATLAPEVDVLLCETMSCAREARAAAAAALETGREVWVALTLQGNRPGTLSGGEPLADAVAALADLPVEALLVNCCGANLVDGALATLARLAGRRFGGYANADEVHPAPFDPADPERVPRTPLEPAAYAAAAARWVGEGASIVGGCCGTRPAHVAAMREVLDRG